MQPLFFGNNILHLLPYLKCFFRAGCKSLPAVIVRDSSFQKTEPVEIRYRRYSPDDRRNKDKGRSIFI